MARITVEDCIDKFPSRFELVLVASQRARKLHSGEDPVVEKDNDKNTVIALREIADSVFTVDQMKENLIQEYQTVTISDEEDENLELDIQEESLEELTEKPLDLDASAEKIITSDLENEMNELIATEDTELEGQYEIKDIENITNMTNEDPENSIKDEAEVTKKDSDI